MEKEIVICCPGEIFSVKLRVRRTCLFALSYDEEVLTCLMIQFIQLAFY